MKIFRAVNYGDHYLCSEIRQEKKRSDWDWWCYENYIKIKPTLSNKEAISLYNNTIHDTPYYSSPPECIAVIST